MAKNKSNVELIKQRIEQKVNLLRTSPDAIVYEFNNPTIRTQYRVPTRVLSMADIIFKDYWGFKIKTEDIEKLNTIINKVYEKALDVADMATALATGATNKSIEELKSMRFREKEKAIRENKTQIEVILPQSEKIDAINESIIMMDMYDTYIKRNREVEEVEKWIKAIQEFQEIIAQAEKDVVELTAECLRLNDLGKYKALRNNVFRYLKETGKIGNPSN
jgi:hypothetical protein